VTPGAGAPNQLLALALPIGSRRLGIGMDRHGSIDCLIELQNVPGSFGGRRCEPIFFAPTPF
jgi:hypothetical protein